MIVVPPRRHHNWWPLLSEHAAPMLRDTFVFWWLSTSSLSFGLAASATVQQCCSFVSLSFGLATSATVPPCCSFVSLSFFATSSHELSPRPRPSWASQQLARPRLFSASAALARPRLFRPQQQSPGHVSLRPQQHSPGHVSLRSQQHSPGHVSLRPQQHPLDHVFDLSRSSRFAVSPRWCPACNAHPSRDTARRLGTVLCSFVSLPQPLCFFSFTVPCSLFLSWVFFPTNSLEGEYCSVPPSHTHLNFVLSYFIFIVHNTTCIQRILIHARTFFHFRLAQAPEQSTWLFLSLHRLPAFLLVATSHLLSSVLIKFFLRWSLFHHVVSILVSTSFILAKPSLPTQDEEWSHTHTYLHYEVHQTLLFLS